MKGIRSQQGAALLMAMLTVTLVSVLAASALWQQWRGVEVQAAERARTQQAWVLIGALDWARLILREDARSGPVDHLSEPWALPLQESRLSSFLAMDKDNTENSDEVYLSGQITDLQSRMNVTNLTLKGKLSEPAVRAFARLFTLLNLPLAQLQLLVDNLRMAHDVDNAQPWALLAPQRLDQLTWLGLSSQTLNILRPHITLLPLATTVNLNTASAEVIHASIPGMDFAQAQRMVNLRSTAHFRTVAEALKTMGVTVEPPDLAQLSTSSRHFEIQGRLRLGSTTVQERSLVERRGIDVMVLWREREVVNAASAFTTTTQKLQTGP